MSEELLVRIEATLGQLVVGQARLEDNAAKLEGRFDNLEGRFAILEGRFDRLEGRVDKLEGRFDKLEECLETGLQDLGHQMRILHEDVIDRIKALSDPSDMLRREMNARDEELPEDLTRRLDPLELTVRDHSAELARLAARG
jgi:chromosome segregation ATPase